MGIFLLLLCTGSPDGDLAGIVPIPVAEIHLKILLVPVVEMLAGFRGALAEEEIFNQFAELAKGKIAIFVSHRLSSAVNADKIVVLKNGSISEMGTHGELMEKNGDYKLLFSTQAQHYIDSQND